jgi:hypothetical protein
MSRQVHASVRRSIGKALLLAALAGAAGGPARTLAAGEARPAASAPARRQPTVRYRVHGLQDRVRLLTKALDLDARQQAQLRKVLESQRQRVLAAWNDTSVAPARRIAATQAISEETNARIRALLNEEQRRKFGPPRQAREPEAPGPSVEAWMSKTAQK